MNTRPLTLFTALALCACGPRVDLRPDAGAAEGDPCSPGVISCSGKTRLDCEDGVLVSGETCDDSCAVSIGCATCAPGSGTCSGTSATVCRADGSGYDEFECDPVQGMGCEPDTGRCEGGCAPHRLGDSYIGCEYYATVTANEVSDNFNFAIAVSNTSTEPATVQVEGGVLTSALVFEVAAGSVEVKTLPWVPLLKAITCVAGIGCGPTTQPASLIKDGAYRVRSNRPVTLYQFNALEYTLAGNEFSYTNDASLLLPTNVLRKAHIVSAWQAWAQRPGFVSVVAAHDNTTLNVNLKASTLDGNGAPAFEAGEPKQVTLNAGDVLQVLAYGGDLTGSTVDSDQPVQVLAGHYCTNVPESVAACDHLEETMFPIETLSRDYIVTPPAQPGLAANRQQYIRVVAARSETTLSYDPPQPGLPNTLALRGDFIEIPNSSEPFVIHADHKVLVAQYMTGQGSSGTGDPAMTLAVATDQFRSEYRFHGPLSYVTNYVNVVAPSGSEVFLDGMPLTGLSPIGNSGYDWVQVQLDRGTGDHSLLANQPVGVTVYGYGDYTSFWYPGGLNLKEIPVE